MQDVVEELIALVPQADTAFANIAHRGGYVQEMLEELGGDVFVDVIAPRQLERNAHQVERVHGHPAGGVRLIDVTAGRQLCAAIEHPDVVEAEEPALKHVASLRVLAVHPPGEIQHQLVKHALKEFIVAMAAQLAVDLEHSPRSPGVYRWIDVAERPFVGRYLPIRMHVPLAREQYQLLLGELAVEMRERNAVERKIPGRVPGIFPLFGHPNYVGVAEVLPVAVALPAGRRTGLSRIPGQPLMDVEVVVLLAPDHAGECLALNQARIRVCYAFLQLRVELVRLTNTRGKHLVKINEWGRGARLRQSQPQLFDAARRHVEPAPHGCLSTAPLRINCSRAPMHEQVVECVLPETLR